MFKQSVQSMRQGKQIRSARSSRVAAAAARSCRWVGLSIAAAVGAHAAGTAANAATYSWGFNTGGNWNESTATTGWNAGGLYPNAAGDVAVLSRDIGSGGVNVTITTGDAMIGAMTLADTGTSTDGPWNFATTDTINNKLTFQALSGNATLTTSSTAQNNANTFNVPIVLNSGLTASIGAGGSTAFVGIVSGTGGITKTSTGFLSLSNNNLYQGGTFITSGAVRVTGSNQSLGTGGVTLTGNTELRLANIANVASGQTVKLTRESNQVTGTKFLSVAFDISQAQLVSLLNTDARGTLSLVTGGTATTQALDMALLGDGTMFLGASGTSAVSGDTALTSTYGASTLGVGADNTYRLGTSYNNIGTLAITNNVLAETSGTKLIIGQALSAHGGGTVQLNAAAAITGTTTVDGGTLRLFGPNGSLLLSSGVTANAGTTVEFSSSTSGQTGTTRLPNLTMNRATLLVTGNTGANTNETISGAVTLNNATNTFTLTGQATRNNQLTIGSLVRNQGATALFRGLNLGRDALSPATVGSTNLRISTDPSAQLVGGGGGVGTTTISILPYAIGATSATSSGTSFVTYDGNGIRPLNLSTEYVNTFADLDSLTNNVNVGVAGVSGINTAATINSLLLSSTGATVAGSGTINVTSGAVFATGSTTISGAALAFGAREGFIGQGTANTTLVASGLISGDSTLTTWGTGSITLSGLITTAGGMIVNGSVTTLSGTQANTYTGGTTVNGGTLVLAKSANTDAVTGDVVINGGVLSQGGNAGQIPDTANIIINGGDWAPQRAETVNSVTVNGGRLILTAGASGTTVTIGNTYIGPRGIATLDANNTGNLNMGTLVVDGGILVGAIDSNPGGTNFFAGNVTITGKQYGVYTPITFTAGSTVQTTFTLNGDLTISPDIGNTNPAGAVLTDGGTAFKNAFILGTGADHTLTVNDGLASVDLFIEPKVTGSGKNLIKAGNGTLQLDGASSYTGNTTINGGRLLVSYNERAAQSVQSATRNSTSTTLTVTSTAGLAVGQQVSGTGINSAFVSVITAITGPTTVTLTNAPSSSGSGNLTFSAVSSTGAGNVVVNGGTLGGTGAILGSITVNNTGNVTPGIDGIGTLTTGSATFNDGGTLTIQVGSGGVSDRLAVIGNLDLTSLLDTLTITGTADGSTYTLATYTGTLTGVFNTTNLPLLPEGYNIDYGTLSNSSITIAVPEPASLGLIAMAGCGLLARRRRGRHC